MATLDLVIIVLYVAGCTLLGAYLGSSAKGLKGYFLGESNIPAWAVMISIVATETSTATFLSVPGLAYLGDLTYLQLPLGYILGRIIVAKVLLPGYFRRQIFTAYEVLQQRFGGATRTTASVLFLGTRVMADGLRLFLAAVVLQFVTGWRIETSIVAVGVSTIIYTYLGGMKAVIWTDVIQFIIYILGAIVALFLMVHRIPGGWGEIWEQAAAANKLRVFDFSFAYDKQFTFWAGLIGGMVLNTATHGADQMMVQRYLAARSERHAAWALIASGFVVLAQFALFLVIGISLATFYRDFPPPNPAVDIAKDREFAYYIIHYLPTGMLGLVVAAIFSAAMSTLSSSLNASASATVNDLYRPLVPQATDLHLLALSKILTAVWGVAQMGMALAAIRFEANVVNNVLAIASFTSGIILGLFLLGIFTRVGQTAALIGLIVGLGAVSYAKFETALAWPWFALVGSSTVFAVGWLLGQLLPQPALGSPPATEGVTP